MSPLEEHRQACDEFEHTIMVSLTLCSSVIFGLVALMAFGVL